MDPEIYYDLKQMSNHAAHYFWSDTVWPPTKLQHWNEFAQEAFDLAHDIWQRHHCIDHAGKEVL